MRVLIAVDDSPCSQAAVDAVADRSWPTGSEFKVISVIEPLSIQYGFAGAYGIESVIEVEQQLAGFRRKSVDKKVEQLAAIFGKGRVTGEVIEGYIADEVIDHAKKWCADLVVCGSHGRHGIQKFLLGSVAEKVVSNAPCSVEVVKVKAEHAAEKEAATAAAAKN